MGAVDNPEIIELPDKELDKMAREGRLWLLQDTANYLQEIMDSIEFPAMLPSERGMLEAAREVIFVLRDVERVK